MSAYGQQACPDRSLAEADDLPRFNVLVERLDAATLLHRCQHPFRVICPVLRV